MNTKILTEVFSETDLTYIQQLDEHQRRLYCATRAINIGKHGVADVCASIHISKNSHDTAEFVCDNIARIWKDYLQWEYPKATAICILCDGGGSNSASHHIFKQELLKLATSLGLDIIIAHYYEAS